MKNKSKKAIISFIEASILAVSMPMAVFATASPSNETLEINIRIEGIKENICCDTFNVPVTDDVLTAADALSFADASDDSFEITGIDSGYITCINNDVAGSFKGYDGWLYTVNGVEAPVSISEYTLNDGDNILLYYGDPYGVGMQFPKMNYNNESGTLTFKSIDTVYDADWNASTVENPVEGLTVTWNNDSDLCFVTDKNGEIKLPNELLTPGTYYISYEKKAENGIPLVLRSEPELSITADYLSGDIDCNRVLDAVDSTLILTYYAKHATSAEETLSPEQQKAADVDGNNVIDVLDATKVLTYYAYRATGGDKPFSNF